MGIAEDGEDAGERGLATVQEDARQQRQQRIDDEEEEAPPQGDDGGEERRVAGDPTRGHAQPVTPGGSAPR